MEMGWAFHKMTPQFDVLLHDNHMPPAKSMGLSQEAFPFACDARRNHGGLREPYPQRSKVRAGLWKFVTTKFDMARVQGYKWGRMAATIP